MNLHIEPILDTTHAYDEWVALYANRSEVAEEYARLLSFHGPVWDGYRPFNEAIVRRWSLAGLKYVKTLAWRITREDAAG